MSDLSVAAVAVERCKTELREFRIPDIPADAGLLRVVATGMCGADWPMYQNDKPGPRILGHEIVGTIERLGELAGEQWGVKVGDLVALEEYLPCGHCDYCRCGEFRSCLETDTRLPGKIRYGSTPVATAPSLWGGYSQFLYLHPRSVMHPVPPGIPSHLAAMALPIGNGFQWAYLDGKAGPGKTIVIHGPGQQGLGCVIAAKAAGAQNIILTGLSTDENRFAVGRALGAHHTVGVDKQDLLEVVSATTGGRLADIVIDCSGAGPAVTNGSIALLRKRGTLIVSSARGPIDGFDIDRIIGKQIVLRGTRGHSFEAVELAISTMAAGTFPLEKMSSHVLGLHELHDGLMMLGGQGREKSIHISVQPWKV